MGKARKSRLFKSSFNVKQWKEKDTIEYLLNNLIKIENIMEGYLNEISLDFPQLTDHSIIHSNMLWNYASIIVGDKKDFLNPIEGFVLHTVFLIHDAGMCYSILNNKEEIENDPIYLDYLAEHGITDLLKEEALFYTVRHRHGDYALRIATKKLKNGEFLIEEESLRDELGLFIGKIAKSHTQNINYVEREFSSIYTVPSFSIDWGIDCQKLALVLRTADAAHIDNLRTPKSIRMIKDIEGDSGYHWTFQKKIGFPQLSEDRLLMYSTNSPFEIHEQKAWWYCYDALKTLDRELRNSNEFFNSRGQEGLNAIGVKFINDTLTLGKEYLRTKGWYSLDSTVKVSNPIHIAAELGGIKLYGSMSFAIRELIQNSIDAINLYRFHTSQDDVRIGEINIILEKTQGDYYLTISDNGIGMSENLITNELLDFGGSYWKSNKFNFEFSGLRSKGFDSIGKFGIGFFSTFMLGSDIKVTSWRYGELRDAMKTLDFYDGLYSSPIIRNSTSDEKQRVLDRGTSIRIKMDLDPYQEKGLIESSKFYSNFLYDIVRYYAPMTNVKIKVSEPNEEQKEIFPQTPFDFNVEELLDLICIPREGNYDKSIVGFYKENSAPLEVIYVNGHAVGKLAVHPPSGKIVTSTAVVVSKGIRVKDLSGLVGFLFVDDVITIKRDDFSCKIPFEEIRRWAKAQIDYIVNNKVEGLFSIVYYNLLITFKYYDESTPMGFLKKDNQYFPLSIESFKSLIRDKHEINFYFEGHSAAARLKDSDGIISLQSRIGIKELVKEEDQKMLLSYDNFVGELLNLHASVFSLL